MPTLQQRVALEYRYSVHFTEHLFRPENDLLARTVAGGGDAPPRRLLAVVDDGLLEVRPELLDELRAYADHHADVIELSSDPIVVPGGEACKNDPALVDRIHRAVSEHGICRHSYVLAIGGGAVIDLAGYAAATAHRGIRLIRVPTTVLAQNDSAVGVKNSVNAYGAKNFLGTFAPPFAVLADFCFLETLDDRDWRAGISEAIKVALLKDPAFFAYLQEHAAALAPPSRDLAAMKHVVVRCAELHLDHIATSGDPFEMGSSRPLDFGHWAAHKLERLTDYTLRHGEAVAIGIALDCAYAHLSGLLSEEEHEAILSLLERLGFALYVPELEEAVEDPTHPRCLFRGLEEFREHLGGILTIMLLEGIGRGVEVNEVDLGRYREAIALLRARRHAAVDVRPD